MFSKESLGFSGLSLALAAAVAGGYSHFQPQLSKQNIEADLAIIAKSKTEESNMISEDTLACYRKIAVQGSSVPRVIHTINSAFEKPLRTNTYVVLSNERGKTIPVGVLPAGSEFFRLSTEGHWQSILDPNKREEIKDQEMIKILLIATRTENNRQVPTKKIGESHVNINPC